MKSLMILCVDHRMYEKEFEECVPKGPYVFSFVGGAKGALKYFETLRDEIATLEGIKGPFEEIIIHDHTNCAAHGGNETQADHEKVMNELQEKISLVFPHLKINKRISDLSEKKIVEMA